MTTFPPGLYESLVTEALAARLATLPDDRPGEPAVGDLASTVTPSPHPSCGRAPHASSAMITRPPR